MPGAIWALHYRSGFAAGNAQQLGVRFTVFHAEGNRLREQPAGLGQARLKLGPARLGQPGGADASVVRMGVDSDQPVGLQRP